MSIANLLTPNLDTVYCDTLVCNHLQIGVSGVASLSGNIFVNGDITATGNISTIADMAASNMYLAGKLIQSVGISSFNGSANLTATQCLGGTLILKNSGGDAIWTLPSAVDIFANLPNNNIAAGEGWYMYLSNYNPGFKATLKDSADSTFILDSNGSSGVPGIMAASSVSGQSTRVVTCQFKNTVSSSGCIIAY